MLSSLVTPMSLVVLSLTLFAFVADAQEPPLARPKHPKVADRDWPRIPLDYFVLAKLEAKGAKAPAEADKETLLRRASLDLTGESPTAEELAAIVADKSWNAYEKAVTRLLATKAYARWQADCWMKCLKGNDPPMRDWLVDAFAADKPLNRIVSEVSEDKRFAGRRRSANGCCPLAGIERKHPGESSRDAVHRQANEPSLASRRIESGGR